jgi:hypothetical protein
VEGQRAIPIGPISGRFPCPFRLCSLFAAPDGYLCRKYAPSTSVSGADAAASRRFCSLYAPSLTCAALPGDDQRGEVPYGGSIRGACEIPYTYGTPHASLNEVACRCRNWAARRMAILACAANPPQTSRGALTGRRRGPARTRSNRHAATL